MRYRLFTQHQHTKHLNHAHKNLGTTCRCCSALLHVTPHLSTLIAAVKPSQPDCEDISDAQVAQSSLSGNNATNGAGITVQQVTFMSLYNVSITVWVQQQHACWPICTSVNADEHCICPPMQCCGFNLVGLQGCSQYSTLARQDLLCTYRICLNSHRDINTSIMSIIISVPCVHRATMRVHWEGPCTPSSPASVLRTGLR